MALYESNEEVPASICVYDGTSPRRCRIALECSLADRGRLEIEFPAVGASPAWTTHAARGRADAVEATVQICGAAVPCPKAPEGGQGRHVGKGEDQERREEHHRGNRREEQHNGNEKA